VRSDLEEIAILLGIQRGFLHCNETREQSCTTEIPLKCVLVFHITKTLVQSNYPGRLPAASYIMSMYLKHKEHVNCSMLLDAIDTC